MSGGESGLAWTGLGDRIRSTEGRLLGLVLAVELLALVSYYAVSGASLAGVRYVLYPLVWINAGLWAVMHTQVSAARPRDRYVAAAVAVCYFLALAWIAGLFSVVTPFHGHEHASHAHVEGWLVSMSAPGWGPRVGYAGAFGHVYFVPYRVVGYLALAYLVYATVLEAATAAISGVVGLGACISCTFPILASLGAGLVGGSTAVAAAVSSFSMDLSTAAFLLALALLYWRPGFGGG